MFPERMEKDCGPLISDLPRITKKRRRNDEETRNLSSRDHDVGKLFLRQFFSSSDPATESLIAQESAR
jgi:hypothetical protein